MKDNEALKYEITRILPNKIRDVFIKSNIDYLKLTEVRIRVNKPIIIKYNNEEFFLNGIIGITSEMKDLYIPTDKEIKELLQYISNYSLYAYEDEVRQGFITIMGGHRVGLAGKIVIDGERIKNIKNISCINIRISHEIVGCAHKIIPYIFDEVNKNIFHTLIVSPPMSGKTTLLRDIIRIISYGYERGKGLNVGVVDERSELAACCNGIPQNDLGIRTDVLDCCPKSEGMMMLIRAMSPNVIAVDEIGTKKDMEAIEYVINCGCKLLATVHGNDVEDIISKPILGRLVKEKIFERYVVLDNRLHIGSIRQIFDKRGTTLYSEVNV